LLDKYSSYPPRIILKLVDLKTTLIERFFSENSNGISNIKAADMYTVLGTFLNEDLEGLSVEELGESEKVSGTSLDVSKAFKKFTNGTRAVLGICEDIGLEKMVMFAAIRSGTKVAFMDLTQDIPTPVHGDLKIVKEALKQAKQVNDEIYFSITNEE
jgi:hypothetical protein